MPKNDVKNRGLEKGKEREDQNETVEKNELCRTHRDLNWINKVVKQFKLLKNGQCTGLRGKINTIKEFVIKLFFSIIERFYPISYFYTGWEKKVILFCKLICVIIVLLFLFDLRDPQTNVYKLIHGKYFN